MTCKYKIRLALTALLILKSVLQIQGVIRQTSCGLGLKNEKVEMTCRCADGEIPFGWFCIPADEKCPNGYYDFFEEKCKCIRYVNENDTSSGCKNICNDECENGVCLGSGKCSCNKGYSMSNVNKCEPICDGGCEHGSCVAPGKCDCNEGYSLDTWTNKCKPICEEGCVNSSCLYPNWCSCYEGYTRVGMNKCEPFCEGGCPEHSECERYGKCICNWGSSMINGRCVPDN